MDAEHAIISGERRLDGADLEARTRRAARGLVDLDVRPGEAVALMLRNDFAFFEVTLAAGTIGAYTVPVNWHFTADEAGYILRDCGAKVLVTHADLLPRIQAAVPGGVDVLVVETPPEIASVYGIEPPACRVPEGAISWDTWRDRFAPWEKSEAVHKPSMFYTSGTTGRPKGVRRGAPDPGRQEQIARVRRDVFGIGPGMRAVLTGPAYHVAPNLFAFGAVRAGGLLMSQSRFDPEELLRLIVRHRITHLHMVPTMFIRLLKLPAAVRAGYDISSLEWVVHGAAPCPVEVKLAMIEWWGPIIHEYYGGTESGPVAASGSADFLARPGTVGRAVSGATVRIYDDDGNRLAPGEVGEIYMHLDAYPDFTYHGQEAARREIEREGLITLGDVGYLDEDGYLFLCDRKRDMVISGGVNIYPAEIEAVLLDMPGVHDCAVFGIPDPEWGEALAAVIEPEAGIDLERADVEAHLRGHQASYKTPQVIEFHRTLPREDSGKIFKRKLRAPYWRDAGRLI
jgi:long-chain acyl-CoA synthetase